MDPITAMATASAAFGTIKKGFQVGRDVESMMSDIGRWMGALSDLDQAAKEAKNPPIFKKLFNGKSVEQEAIEAFSNKRKAQNQRDELKTWIEFTLGRQAWQDLIQTEANIRKQRQDTLYKQRERRQKFVEIIVWIVMVSLSAAILYGFVAFLMSKQAKASNIKMTTCRLAAQEVVGKSNLLCFYIGAGNTQEQYTSEVYMGCQKQYQCVYNPRPEGASLKDTMKSIKDALE
tara:strand:+ start:863 stop:1558 length:696 start_codon:yes stop_codon:yes gene_type:complete